MDTTLFNNNEDSPASKRKESKDGIMNPSALLRIIGQRIAQIWNAVIPASLMV